MNNSGAGSSSKGAETAGRDEDLALLLDTVASAGAIALGYFGASPNKELKSDGSEVSEADIAVNDHLQKVLMGARPDYGWLSEETDDDARRLDCQRVWVVDPIDGTRAFLREKPEWTVSVALVEDRKPVLAAVFNPAKDALYHAIAGGGAFLSGQPAHVEDRSEIAHSHFAAAAELFRKKFWSEPWPPLDVRWVNSIAYRMALVASGHVNAVISLSNKNDWDLAAADLLVQEAGGKVTTQLGEPFLYNGTVPRQDSVVAAGPLLHALLLERTMTIQR